MKVTPILTGLAFIILLSSCGESQEEKVRLQQMQQAREDSIKRAGVEEARQKFENKKALQDSLERTSDTLAFYKTTLSETKATLEAAQDEMNRIKEFHLGRLDSEREQQIKNQSLKIQSLQADIKKGEAQVKDVEGQIGKIKTAIENSY